MAFWASSQLLLIASDTDATSAYSFFAASTVSWAVAVPSFIMFVRHQTSSIGLMKTPWIPRIFFFSAAALSVGIWQPGLLVEKMVPAEAGGFVHEGGRGYAILGSAHVVGGLLLCLAHVVVYLRSCAPGPSKEKARLILVSIVVPLVMGASVHLISYDRLPKGPDMIIAITALNGAMVGVGMLRYRLFTVNLDETAVTLVETLSEGLLLCDESGSIRFVNPATSDLYDMDPTRILGQNLRNVLQPSDEVKRAIELANRGRPVHGEGEITRRDGFSIPVEYTVNAVRRRKDDPIQGFVCAIRDVGPLKSLIHQLEDATRQLEQQAVTDPLTGSYNRRYLEARLEEEFQASRRYKRAFSLIMLDLDHFKRVNDTQGHDVGDHLLKIVTNTLRDQVRTSDLVTRYGGDEFMVIMPETDREDAAIVVERLRQELSHDVYLRGVRVTASFGLVTYRGEASVESASDLMRRVDQAMLESKNRGRDCVRIVDIEPDKVIEDLPPFIVETEPIGIVRLVASQGKDCL